jgi:hypothetical protein
MTPTPPLLRLFGLLTLFLAVLVSGCSTRYSHNSKQGDEDSDWSDLKRSGTEATTRGSLEVINLVELMDPDGRAEKRWQRENQERADDWDKLSWATRYDITMSRFAEINLDSAVSRRNLVQNRLMVAAERRCGRYVQYLRTDSSNMNFRFATTSGVLSTLGALLGHADTAKAFSGLSAMTSGVRAEYNNEYYSNLAISVIVRGIAEKRRMLQEDIETKQRSRGYADYDIAAAVRDAVEFDAACNVVNGLETANEAVQRLNEPGRDAMNRALLKQNLTNALASRDVAQIEKHNQIVAALKLDTATVNARFLATPLVSGQSSALEIGLTDPVFAVRETKESKDAIKGMATEASSAIVRDINASPKASTPTLTATVASVNAALGTLTSHINTYFDGTTTGPNGTITGCFEEAKALSSEYHKLISAQAKKGETALQLSDGDALDAMRRKVADFAAILNRMRTATQQVLSNARAKVRAGKVDDDAQLIKAGQDVVAALTPKAWDEATGSLRCK